MSALEKAIERLRASVEQLGGELPPPSTPLDLAELESEIAPMRLPAQLIELWQLVEPERIPNVYTSRIDVPETALMSWRMVRDDFPDAMPRSFLPIANEHTWDLAIELDAGDGVCGSLFGCEGELTLLYHDLAELINHGIAHIEAGTFELVEASSGGNYLVPNGRFKTMGEVWAQAPTSRTGVDTHPHYGDRTQFADTVDWPDRWLRTCGFSTDDLKLKGATHSIHDLAHAPPDLEEATIVGEVVTLAGGQGTNIRLRDESGEIAVFVPTEVGMFGPRIRQLVEIDVRLISGRERVPPAIEGTPEDRFVAMYAAPPSAIATALRPV